MRTHTKERPYLCSVCGKGFTLNRNLRRHVMIHTGEKPHKCHLCDKAFIQFHTLQDHLRVHSGERPFICNICGISYKQSVQLKLHMKRHSENVERKRRKRGLLNCLRLYLTITLILWSNKKLARNLNVYKVQYIF